MLKLVAQSEIPTAGFCMGDFGLPSRVLCGKYGSPLTYATFSKERELAPGQLSFEEMQSLYRYDEITAETQVFGVLGDPIGHSLSPLLHNAAFQKQGLNAVYLPFRMPKDSLARTLAGFEWLGIQGYSVTIPHKEAVLEAVEERDGPVQAIGAANTLYRDPAGRWHCTNTDYDAALESLCAGMHADSDETALKGRKVLMLGAGGVARAIGLGVTRAGGVLTISNRSPERADELAEQLDCLAIGWASRSTVFAEIIINCTPMGMHPNVNETPYPLSSFREGALAFDTVYNPENTLFLKQARERGCRTVSGIEMFVRQAALQFKYFTGEEAPLDDLRETLRRGISAVKL